MPPGRAASISSGTGGGRGSTEGSPGPAASIGAVPERKLIASRRRTKLAGLCPRSPRSATVALATPRGPGEVAPDPADDPFLQGVAHFAEPVQALLFCSLGRGRVIERPRLAQEVPGRGRRHSSSASPQTIKRSRSAPVPETSGGAWGGGQRRRSPPHPKPDYQRVGSIRSLVHRLDGVAVARPTPEDGQPDLPASTPELWTVGVGGPLRAAL